MAVHYNCSFLDKFEEFWQEIKEIKLQYLQVFFHRAHFLLDIRVYTVLIYEGIKM